MENQRINEVVRLGLDNPDVIPLWFGESDLVTPDYIRSACKQALDDGKTFYVHRRGIKPLRNAVTEYTNRLYGPCVDVERVTITASGMTSIMIAMQCLVNNGDNVVLVSPIWPNIFYAINSMGGECRHVKLEMKEDGWQLDMQKLMDSCDERTKAIYIASPSNPTGWVMSREEQLEVLNFCRRTGIWMISDEVYHRLVYQTNVAPSFLEIANDDDPLFVIQSASKTWSMTGWRLGWLIHPSSIGDRIGDLSAINNTGATSFVQHAGLVAIQKGESFVREMVEYCRAGLEVVDQRLKNIERINYVRPDSAFYLFFRIEEEPDDLQFAKELVTKHGVGLAPGSAFGPSNEGYYRLCFAKNPAKLEQAIDRLESAIR
jgi:aspartate aminotransferase